MINGAAFGPDGRQPATARESLIFALPPRQPSWPEANVHVEATQVAAGHQKMSAAISSKNFLVNTWRILKPNFARSRKQILQRVCGIVANRIPAGSSIPRWGGGRWAGCIRGILSNDATGEARDRDLHRAQLEDARSSRARRFGQRLRRIQSVTTVWTTAVRLLCVCQRPYERQCCCIRPRRENEFDEARKK